METAIARPTDTLAVIARELDRSPQLASGHSRRTYLGALSAFEDWRAGRPMAKLLVEEYAAHLLDQGQAPATVNHALAAIRWWARRLADLAAEDPTLAPNVQRTIVDQAVRASTVRNVKGEGTHRGRHVADGEVRALLEACLADAGPSGTRDAAIVALAFATGMRRAELVGLLYEDLAPIDDGYDLIIRHGKGNKTRSVAVFNGAQSYLDDWMALRGSEPGPLFLAIRKGGHIQTHGLGTQSLEEMLDRRAAQAGVTNVNWHDARRTLAGSLLDDAVDLATVQKIMGHSSPVTTAAYDRRPEETRRKALRGLHVPYLRN